MYFFQKEITLPPVQRGFHLISSLLEFPEMEVIEKGMFQVFIKHTSAALTINENCDPTVRQDFEQFFNHLVPENATYFKHTYEGPDDMPAHLKASLLSSSVQIPIKNGKWNMGTWQGIYLCEHRNHGGRRHLVLSAWGI